MIDEELDMEQQQQDYDYEAAIRGLDAIAPTLATTSLDKNPDDGVRALEISKATGVPAPAVMDDLDGYDSQLKAGLTSRIVSDNEVIAEYLRENPLADVVSNDDYGNMDNFARTVPNKDYFDKVIADIKGWDEAAGSYVEAVKAGILGAGQASYEAFTKPYTKEEIKTFEQASPAMRFAYSGADLGSRLFEAVMAPIFAGPSEFVGKLAEEAGEDPMWVERIKRDTIAFVEDAMGRASHIMPERIAEGDILRRAKEAQAFEDQAIAQTDALNRARPWVESGMEPPTRTAPEIDALKAEVNFNAVEAIYANHDAALQMLTKERSPELAAAYIKKFYGENSIGIPAERIVQLYGDSVPEAGDGILGWVPDLAQQLEDGLATGGDVRIPLADWIANVDPQVANGLKPDMRVWPGGITATEAAGKVEPKAVVDSPIAQARAALGTEPLVGFGDRKFTVQKAEAPIEEPPLDVTMDEAKGTEFLKQLYDLRGDLSLDELTAIFKYTRDSARGFAAEKDLFSDPMVMENLLRAGKKIRAPQDFVVYRGHGRGDPILKEGGISSTSLSKEHAQVMAEIRYAEPELTKIVVKKGTPIIPIAEGGELEILLPHYAEEGKPVTTIFSDFQDLSEREVTIGPEKLQFLGDTGEPIGELTVIPEGNRLRVEDISGDLGMYADTIGPSSFVDITKQLKGMFPEAEELVIPQKPMEVKPITTTKAMVGDIGAALSKGDVDIKRFDVPPTAEELNALISAGETFNDAEISRIFGADADNVRKYMTSDKYSDQLEDIVQEYGREAERVVFGMHEGGVVNIEQLEKLRENITNVELAVEQAAGGNFASLGQELSWIARDLPDIKADKESHSVDQRRAVLSLSRAFDEMRRLGVDVESTIKQTIDYTNLRVDGSVSDAKLLLSRMADYVKMYLEPAEVSGVSGKVEVLSLVEPITKESYTKTKYALSKIHEDKIVSEILSTIPEDPALESALAAAKEQFDALRASQAGLSKKAFDNLQKLFLGRHEDDLKAHLARVERMQRKTQTKEWKAAEIEVRNAVAEKIGRRPDVLADALIGSGELAGKKLKQVYPLREDALTPEQKAGLPRHYYSKEGIVPDMVAGMFGYPSGDMMVNDLIKYNADRGKKSAKEHLKSVIDAETQRAMEWMHGKLDENIMRDAIDQATSDKEVNIVLEEWQGYAMSNGITTITKEVLKAEAQEAFGRLKAGDVNFTDMQRLLVSHLENANKAILARDYESAVRSLEQRSRVKVMMAEAKKFDKTKAAFEKTAKTFSKRVVEGAEKEYTNWIHHILMRVGRRVSRFPEDLRKEIDATGITTLESFVDEKASMFREVAVWDELFDESWSKDIDTMTVDEYRAVADSIKSMVFHARDERKIYRAGEAADLAEIKKLGIDGIYKSAAGAIAEPTKGIGRKLKTYYVAHLQTENVLNRWDGFDPNGIWNQYIMRDLIDGANQIDAWKKEYAKRFQELSVPKNIRDSIDNTLFYDRDTYAPIKFTRKNLIAVMLNTGTGTGKRSNLYKLAKGYGLEPEAVMKWVDDHATAEDWKLVREIWDIFADIKKKSDTMYRSLSGGVPAEDLPTYPISTRFGEVAGGYYPIFWHSEMEGKSTKLMGKDVLEGEGYYRATTPAGYTKSRTGYVAPMALDFDHLPGRISQMLQDIGLRPAIINASKLFYDHDVRSAIRRHYGVEYKDMLQKYLEGVANSGNNWSLAQREMSQLSELVRQNLISTLVGLNPGTVLKHFPSAAVTSIRQVGPQRFLEAVQSLHRVNETTGESNWQFAMKNSLELQRRDRNWEESIVGASTGALSPGDLITPWRQRIIQLASKPVALSDMISAVPTWLAEYGKQMDAGETHGDAVYMADRAVRYAHGSTAVTTRTQIMRESSGWLTSVYNFFSDIMNRQMETIWRAGEMAGKVKEGDMKGAIAAGGAFTASLFAYAIWPAIVEHMVSGQAEDEHESWGVTAAKAGLRTAASSWVGVRDFTNWMLYGNDPQFGMAGTAMKEAGQLLADLKKDHPFRKDHMGRVLQDLSGLIGLGLGVVPLQIGKSARYIHDVSVGIEHPKGPWAWAVGLRFGTTKGHSQSWEDFVKGKVRK